MCVQGTWCNSSVGCWNKEQLWVSCTAGLRAQQTRSSSWCWAWQHHQHWVHGLCCPLLYRRGNVHLRLEEAEAPQVQSPSWSSSLFQFLSPRSEAADRLWPALLREERLWRRRQRDCLSSGGIQWRKARWTSPHIWSELQLQGSGELCRALLLRSTCPFPPCRPAQGTGAGFLWSGAAPSLLWFDCGRASSSVFCKPQFLSSMESKKINAAELEFL